MESGSFPARVISNNRITLDEKIVELMEIKQNDILKITVERMKP